MEDGRPTPKTRKTTAAIVAIVVIAIVALAIQIAFSLLNGLTDA